MEYQKIINLLDYTNILPSKFITKNWVDMNDDRRGTYSKSSLCDYNAAKREL